MNNRQVEAWNGAAWLASALYVIAASVRLGTGRPSSPGPGFIFLWSGIILAALALKLLVDSRKPPSNTEVAARPDRASRILPALGFLTLYAVLFEPVGFLLTTPLMVAAMVKLGGERSWSRIAVFAVAATLGAYVILHGWLGVRLPGA